MAALVLPRYASLFAYGCDVHDRLDVYLNAVFPEVTRVTLAAGGILVLVKRFM
jgi:hypothetical protein